MKKRADQFAVQNGIEPRPVEKQRPTDIENLLDRFFRKE
jgi:hypothetical protein